MKKEIIHLPEFKIIGLSTRTCNKAEMSLDTAKIGPLVQKYFQLNTANKIQDRVKPGITYSAFTEYEKDHTTDYTYFIGEEVTIFENIPAGYTTLIIPAQHYIRFTNGPGQMPDVVINVWTRIWQMNTKQLGGARSYLADFEIYDERARDPQNTIVDVYVGVKK